MKVNLEQLCMNAGTELEMDYVIRYNLKKNHKFFENIFISDGHLTDDAKKFYSQFENVTALDLPWQDNYARQYIEATRMTQEGSWILHLDADELPSENLLQSLTEAAIDKNINMIKLPCQLHLTEDGKHFYPAEPHPETNFVGQWTKNILFKKDKTLDFRFFGSHVIPNHGADEKAKYLMDPYFHLKSLQSFCENDVFQAFLSPEGQGYSKVEAAQFLLFIRDYKTTKDFRQGTKDGTWPINLQKFAYHFRNEFHRPISRLYWQYHILNGHPCFKDDHDLTWEVVRPNIQSEKVMKLFEHNKANKIGEIIIEEDF